jgi:hypothetical protein
MNLQLIEGAFSTADALELITQMVHVKIKYHENKIIRETPEEDIKRREAKIKRLQKELFELRGKILSQKEEIKLNAIINLEND